MADIFDTAKYVLESCGSMSTMKLQKLCYYCQAWSLAWTERPLFGEKIEAWVNGPVCPALFQVHKGQFLITAADLPFGDSARLSADEKDTIDRVLAHYASWDPYMLREQTHSEAPWQSARCGIPDGVNSAREITPASMGEYYGSL